MNLYTKVTLITVGVFFLVGSVITIKLIKKAAPTDSKLSKKPVKKSDLSKIYNSSRPSIVQIPPEPMYGNHVSVFSPSSPKALSDAVSRLKDANPTSIGTAWNAFLQKQPTHENLTIFLKSLDMPQLFELMEYTCESDPSFASGFMESDIIPELKARWSQDGSPWQNQVPYEQLLQIASDKQKPDLLRQVIIDLLGSSKAMTTENQNAVLEQISQGLAGIIQDRENAGIVRAYAVADLGIISQQLHGEASPYSEYFLQLAQDSSENMSVRVRSLQMLPLLDNVQAIPILQESCLNYQSKDDPAVAKATVVALSDYAQKNKIDALSPVSHVLVVTMDSDVFGASIYAASRLDESSFMTVLPILVEQKNRFHEDSLVEDSVYAALWRQPNAVMNAVNSEEKKMVQAGIEAACYVPLPPIKERLEKLLASSPPGQYAKIEKAIEKAKDRVGYEEIMNQIAKEREGHNGNPKEPIN